MATAAVQRGGTAKGPGAGTDASLYIDSEAPGQWVVKLAPPPTQNATPTVTASGWVTIIEGAAGSMLTRRIPWTALGVAFQCRGANIQVLIEPQASFGVTTVFCTASQGAITERWAPIPNVAVAGAGVAVISLPQFAKRFRMANQSNGGGPLGPLAVTFEDSTQAPICDVYMGVGGAPIEFDIPANAVFVKVSNGDIPTLVVAASVLVDE